MTPPAVCLEHVAHVVFALTTTVLIDRGGGGRGG